MTIRKRGERLLPCLPEGAAARDLNKKAASKRTGELPCERALIAESVDTAFKRNLTEKDAKVKDRRFRHAEADVTASGGSPNGEEAAPEERGVCRRDGRSARGAGADADDKLKTEGERQ